jgi:hypothetical protein
MLLWMIHEYAVLIDVPAQGRVELVQIFLMDRLRI